MKILFISHELPPVGGGGGRALWQIACRLAARDHAITILTGAYEGLPREERREGVHIRRISARRARLDACPPLELLSFVMQSVSAADRLAREAPPDVLCAFFAVPGGPAAWRVRRKRGIPYVLALRGSDVPRPQLGKYQRLHLVTRPFVRRILRDASAVTAVSHALKEAAMSLNSGAQIEVAPNGVDTEFFAPPSNEERREDLSRILFVGRLQPFKGVQVVIEVLPEIEERLGRPVALTVVGDGPYRRELKRRASAIRAAGAASRVEFSGWVAQAMLRDAYRDASVLVLPSAVEGHPNVLLEGMASGLPCVASDVPGIREVASSEAGFLVPPNDSAAWGRAIADILSDPDRHAEMSRAARRHAHRFSWDATAETYERLLRRAVEGESEG